MTQKQTTFMQGIQDTLGVTEDLNQKGLCQIQAQPFYTITCSRNGLSILLLERKIRIGTDYEDNNRNGKETVINLSGQLDTLTSVDLEKRSLPSCRGKRKR